VFHISVAKPETPLRVTGHTTSSPLDKVKALARETAHPSTLKMVNLKHLKRNAFIATVLFLRKKKAA
jgi:hypothetical protein